MVFDLVDDFREPLDVSRMVGGLLSPETSNRSKDSRESS